MSKPTGVEVRHELKCSTRRGGKRCNCAKRYRGGVWNPERKAMDWGPWGTSSKEAQTYRAKALLERGAARTARTHAPTLREAVEQFLAEAKAGTARDRKGNVYKPSTLRGYERGWRLHIEPDGLAPHRLSDIRRSDLQGLVDRLGAKGLRGSTIRNIMNPMQVVYRRAVQRDVVATNPTIGLDLPQSDGKRERFATREEAASLIAALPEGERALWAAAFYGGLRRGELRALRWSDIGDGIIEVRRSWDDNEGEGEPKTASARRKVPIVPPLADLLDEHKRLTGLDDSDLLFGRTASEPFYASTVRSRALAAWKRESERVAKEAQERGEDPPAALVPIGLHEARHTCASLMIAAGCNAKALSVVLGHASIQITFDRYGHLMPGGEAEVGRLLGEYLADG